MVKIGAITVGQSPRTDVMADIEPLFRDKAEVLQQGALDGLTKSEINLFAPVEGDYVLVSRLADGSWVKFAKKHILRRLQSAIDTLTLQGVSAIMMLCTGEFHDLFVSAVPLLYPDKLLSAVVPAICSKKRIVVLTPDEEQRAQVQNRWAGFVQEAVPVIANPYEGVSAIERILPVLKALDAGLTVFDCIGYTSEMKRLVQKETGWPALLPRTLLAQIACELTL